MLTNDETREAKNICVECLNKIDVGSYNLRYADPRLDVYARTLIDDPDAHNLYELLALQRFFRFLDTYEFHVDKIQGFIRFYEFLKFDEENQKYLYK